MIRDEDLATPHDPEAPYNPPDFVFEGFQVTIRHHRFASWTAHVTGPAGQRWQSSSAWTRWGARHDARWVITHYLLPGHLRRLATIDRGDDGT